MPVKHFEEIEILSAAVKENGYALRYVSEELRNDRGCFGGGKKYGGALEYASEALRGDRDFVLAAVSQMEGHLSMPVKNIEEIEILSWQRLKAMVGH